MSRHAALAVLLSFCAGALPAAEVTTVSDIRIFGGQHFYNGAASEVAGNVSAVVTPVVKMSDGWSLVPTYMGEYRGTRDVQELAGGGTLFQDSTRHGLTVKSVHGRTWKFKPSLGYAREWLRETKDENWGNGLFNNQKISGGVEEEWSPSKDAGGRLSYDYYQLKFPNYHSLEAASDPSLARELAGDRVLDSRNHLVTFSMWTPFPGRARLGLDASYNLRTFDDQPVLDVMGQPSGTARADKMMSLGATLGSRVYPLSEELRMTMDLGLSYAMNDSNQSGYDANQGVPLKNNYSYGQWGAAPRLTAALGEAPWILSAGLGYTARAYADRPVQDAAGAYVGSKTKVTNIDTSLELSYPYSKNFKVRAVGSLAWSSSNMKYEKVYRYNYKIANYMVGFSYEY